MRYRSQRDDDAGLGSKPRELAQQRRRFGYHRLHILLRREDVVINRKKTRRHNPRGEVGGPGAGGTGAVPSVQAHRHPF